MNTDTRPAYFKAWLACIAITIVLGMAVAFAAHASITAVGLYFDIAQTSIDRIIRGTELALQLLISYIAFRWAVYGFILVGRRA